MAYPRLRHHPRAKSRTTDNNTYFIHREPVASLKVIGLRLVTRPWSRQVKTNKNCYTEISMEASFFVVDVLSTRSKNCQHPLVSFQAVGQSTDQDDYRHRM